ncbi:MAG: TolC family protein, partial [Bacteroidales bacterium]|nr:TolC family protein [Bacteroidales bacterium]
GLDYSYTLIDDIRVVSLPERLDPPQTYFIPEEQQAAATGEAQLLELQLKAKELEKKMILGEALPSLGIGASAGYGHYIGDGSFNGIVFAMLKLPLSDWGKTSRKLQRQDTEILKVANEKKYLDAQLVLRSRQRWLELELAWEQMLLSEENLAYAEDELSRCQGSFEAGLVTLSELMQAQTTLRQAQDSLIDDRIAYKTAIAEYLN